MNVAKVAQLAARGEYLFRMWAETLASRSANKRNQCLGKELEALIKLADDHFASEEEYERYLEVYRAHHEEIRVAVCNHYTRGHCSNGDDCRFMHLDAR